MTEELLELLTVFFFGCIAGICVAPANNDVLKILAEVVLRAEKVRVGEVEK